MYQSEKKTQRKIGHLQKSHRMA